MPDSIHLRQDRPALAIALTLLAFFTFSCLDASAKWLALAGIPALQIGFMRYAVHFGFSVIETVRAGRGAPIRSPRMGLVLLRSVMLMTSTLCNFIAVLYLPLTLTATIMFSTPIIVTALSGPVLGEKVGIWRWGAIGVGFIGVVIAIRPFDAEFHWAALVSLGGATAFAVYALLTRLLSDEVSARVMQFWGGAVGTVALLPAALWLWTSPEDWLGWALMIVIGFCGWFGHGTLTRAYGYAEASALVPFNYSQLVFLGGWSFLIFGNAPDGWTLTGAAIVVSAGMTIWLRERRKSRRKMRMLDEKVKTR